MIYTAPEKYGCTSQLIPIPSEDIDILIEEHVPDDLLSVLGKDVEDFCKGLWVGIGAPKLTAKHGWAIFADLLLAYDQA